MNYIPIKEEINHDGANEKKVYIIPALSLNQSSGATLKVPHPLGAECIVFATVEEAKTAIERAGFLYILPNGIKAVARADCFQDYDKLIFESLTALTNDMNATVVASAISALGDIQNRESIDLFLEKIGEDNEAIRSNAVEALFKYGNVTVERLIETLKDPNWVKRNSAIICIGKLADVPSIDLSCSVLPLVEKLKDTNNIVKSTAAVTLGKIYKSLKSKFV